MDQVKWRWFGQPGHFICADRCVFHLHTHVGKYCISTVGEYFPLGLPAREGTKPEPTGASKHLYETMVFELDEKKESIVNYSELDARRWMTRDEANNGHLDMCKKWSK